MTKGYGETHLVNILKLGETHKVLTKYCMIQHLIPTPIGNYSMSYLETSCLSLKGACKYIQHQSKSC